MKHSTLAVTTFFTMALLLAAAASPLGAELLVHYTFDQVDTDGVIFTTPDSSGRGNTGTLTNMDNTSPVSGRVGNALQFSNAGTNLATRDRVQVGLDANNPADVITDLNRTYTQFTFAAFVKPVGIAADEVDTTFFAGKLGNSPNRGWQIGLTGTDAPTLAHPHEIVVSLFEGPLGTDNDNEFYSGPQTAVVNDQWAHVAFTFSSITEPSSFFKMYINGEKVVDATTDLLQMNGVNTRPFQIGNRGDSRADSWGGLIDDVYLFDHALTDEEIAALIPPLPPAQVGDYNGNGIVDAADYTLWRDTLGSDTDLRADGDGSLIVDLGDYTKWVENFGAPGSLGAGASAEAVPEPSSLLLAMAAVAAVVLGYWRSRSRA
ncbi:MAG: LamG domain-containing protein [Pirellulales bacterium]